MTEDMACRGSGRLLETLRRVLGEGQTILACYKSAHDDYELSVSRHYGALLGAWEKISSAIELMEEKLLITQTTKIK